MSSAGDATYSTRLVRNFHLAARVDSQDERLGMLGYVRSQDLTDVLQTEHRNPEGRTYWFNTGTRESVWEKPDGKFSPLSLRTVLIIMARPQNPIRGADDSLRENRR